LTNGLRQQQFWRFHRTKPAAIAALRAESSDVNAFIAQSDVDGSGMWMTVPIITALPRQ
jgi:hypothetical protein